MSPDERRASRGSRGAKHSLFDIGEFVAVDGEGFSEGPEKTWSVGANEEIYTGREHFYSLLSASDGSEIYAPNGRLSAKQCLDFLIEIKERNSKAILVCFGASYDITQMLAYDLTREQIVFLMRGDPKRKSLGARASVDISLGEHDYRLEYRSRKAFSIWRWPRGADKHYQTDDGKWKMTKCAKATLWDVWGFFQDSFMGVLKKWIPQDPDYNFIAKMKGERNVFDRSEIEVIRKYNLAELRCLATVMDMVRDSVKALDLTLSRWDGAGAIAGAMMKHNDVASHKAISPSHIFEAARYAYSGGHIEVCKLGHHKGPVYHYDVNSAYPHQFRRLPSLANGYWISGKDARPPKGFTLVKIEFRFMDGMPFYPLFYRETNGSIIYPPRGTGWYWYPEFEAARDYAAKLGAVTFNVLEWHHFKPSDALARPFAWIEGYYARRQMLVETAKRTGIPSGEEKILKLGYNACYGKTAQQVGAREKDGEIQEPAYFQIEWSGYVTSGCRAQLMTAAIQQPDAIISFATDGLFSLKPLKLHTPKTKDLGAWEAQIHAGITMVMPGVYWLHEENEAPTHYSRGFDKKQLSNVELIHKAWQRKVSSLPIKVTRLIGLGAAITSNDMWAMRGMFVESKRSLALNGDNSKRYPVMLYNTKPHRELVNAIPRDHFHDAMTPLDEMHSEIYSIDWLPKDGLEDHDIAAARMA